MQHKLRKPDFIGIVLFAAILIHSCMAMKQRKHEGFETPPGTVRLAENLFLDQDEICNLSYMEYLYWTARVYGKESEVYAAAYPDSSHWKEFAPDTLPYLRYLHGRPYRDFPLLGVSLEQAKSFAHWRSDRVMQFILIRENKLDYLVPSSPETAFCIYRYLKGDYPDLKPDDYPFYPIYSIPDSSDYLRYSSLVDSINERVCLKKKSCCEMNKTINGSNSDAFFSKLNPCNPCKKCRGLAVYNLRNALPELTITEGYIFTFDSCKSSVNYKIKAIPVPVMYGFRNVCRWESINSAK